MLSFPPHCSNKLRSLDRTVYEPLKKYINSICAWILNQPDYMTIYDIPKVVAVAYSLVITSTIKHFKCIDIFSSKIKIFSRICIGLSKK